MNFLIDLFASKEKWHALEEFLDTKLNMAMIGRWNVFAFVLVPFGTISFWVSQSDLLSPESNSEGAVMRLDFHGTSQLGARVEKEASVLLFDGSNGGEFRVDYTAPLIACLTNLVPEEQRKNEGKMSFSTSSVDVELPLFGGGKSLGILAVGGVPKAISTIGGELSMDAVPIIGFPNRSGIVIWTFALAAFSVGINLSGAFVSKAKPAEDTAGQDTG